MSGSWWRFRIVPTLLVVAACFPVGSISLSPERHLESRSLFLEQLQIDLPLSELSSYLRSGPSLGKRSQPTVINGTATSQHDHLHLKLEPLPAAGSSGWIQLGSLCVCLLILGFVCSHEATAYFMGTSIFMSNLDVASVQRRIQGSYLLWWVFLMMDPAVLIPTSYELAQEMECSPLTSGLLLGSGYLLTPIGSFAGAYVFKNFPMKVTRLVAIASAFILMAQNLIHAITLDSSDEHGPDTMWFLICLRIVCGIGKFSYVCQYVAYNVTMPPKRVELSILTSVATNAGLCLGPFLTAGMIHMLGGRDVIASVFTRSAAPIYIMATLWAILGLAFAVNLPMDLIPYRCDLVSVRRAPDTPRSHRLTVDERKSIVIHGLEYCIERALAVSAIEAGTAMILETEFHWGSRAIGFSISMVFGATIIICLVIMVLMSKQVVRGVNGLVTMSCISACGALLLFDFHTGSAWNILLADLMIYPFMYCANGIADGIVTGLAVPDSWFSMESYLALKACAMSMGRFVGFPLARYIIDSGGRNMYAGFQMLLGVLGLISVFKIAYTLEWNDPVWRASWTKGPGGGDDGSEQGNNRLRMTPRGKHNPEDSSGSESKRSSISAPSIPDKVDKAG